MSTSDHTKGGPRSQSNLRAQIAPWAWALLALLLIQNVLGIYLNLFVPLPPSHDLASLLASYSVLAVHVTVGFLILGTAGVALYLSARTRRPSLWAPALAALAFAFLAFSTGVEFTIGGQDDILSFLMEIMFLGVVGSDVLVLYLASRLRSPRDATTTASRAAEE